MPFNYISMANCCQTAYETLRILSTRLRSAGGVYLSGGLKPATETSRISFYPPLVEAGVFPTEIKRPRHLPGPAYTRYVNYFMQFTAAILPYIFPFPASCLLMISSIASTSTS